jgi:cysteine-S-conjugate beta-lyase
MYDFTTLVNRKNCGSFKWDSIKSEMGLDSDDIIPMSVADMELKVAPEITNAIKDKAELCIYGYTDPTDSYFNAVVSWMQCRHDWKIKREWISLSTGVVPALYIAVKALTHPGDKVIIQQPVYFPFASAVTLNGCEIANNTLIYKNGRYTINFEDLAKKAADPRTKVMLLCNPHNPVGRVWTKDELKKLGEICCDNNVVVISDEIHFDFVYKPFIHTVFANISDRLAQNCIIMTAPSKTFNLAGLQTSNIIIPNKYIKECYDIASENSAAKSINIFGYTACETAYTCCDLWLDELLEHLTSNKEYLKEYIKENIPKISVIEPEGTYLVWLDCRALGMTGIELEKFMRYKARIFFDEGYLFDSCGDGFERINIACPKSMLKKALENLKAAVDSLQQLQK